MAMFSQAWTEQELIKSLESLTPGGSEFSNDPDRCIAWVKDRLETVAKQARKRQQAEADNAALVEIFSAEGVAYALHTAYTNPSRFGYDTPSDEWEELIRARDFNFKQPHPGTALLEELEQLRFIADAYLMLIEALKELPEVLPKVFAKVNDEEFKERFAKEADNERD